MRPRATLTSSSLLFRSLLPSTSSSSAVFPLYTPFQNYTLSTLRSQPLPIPSPRPNSKLVFNLLTPTSTTTQIPLLHRRNYATEVIKSLVEREIELINDAHHLGAEITARRLINLIRKCQEIKDVILLDRVHELVQRVQPGERKVHNTLISAYASSKSPEKATQVFEQMKLANLPKMKPNAFTWSALLNAYAGQRGKALTLLDQMQESGIKPNLYIFSVLINAHVKAGSIEDALETLDYMKRRRIMPSAYTYTPIIDAYLQRGQKDKALELLSEMEGYHIQPTVATLTTFVHANCRENNFDAAKKILELIAQKGMKPNVVTYTSLIDGLVKNGKLQMAEETLNSMQSVGVEPNHVAYTTLIEAYGKARNPAKCIELWRQMRARGVIPDDIAYVSYIRTLALNLKRLRGSNSASSQNPSSSTSSSPSSSSSSSLRDSTHEISAAEMQEEISNVLEVAVPTMRARSLELLVDKLTAANQVEAVERLWRLWRDHKQSKEVGEKQHLGGKLIDYFAALQSPLAAEVREYVATK